MTLTEVRKIIAKSEYTDWLNQLSINIPYSHLSEPIKKTGLSEIYRFFKNQHTEWSKYDQNMPVQFSKVHEHFQHTLVRLNSFIQSIPDLDQNQASRSWNNIYIQLVQDQIKNEYKIILAETPEISFLLDVYTFDKNSFEGAYEYLIWDRINQNLSASYLKGVLLAYEFQLQGHTDLLKRRNAEKKSISQIRSRFEKHLSEIETETQQFFTRGQKSYDEYLKELDTLKENRTEIFDTWFGTSKQDFSSFYDTAKKDTASIKELFRDGLRFAGPVKHWRKRALLMKRDGAMWIKWLIGSVLLAGASLFTLLWLVPDEMTTALFEGKPQAIKWTLLYITFISFLAYGVRTFAKLTFSSYHLARDAEEREQLTHVYLALKKDGNVEEEDRLIVLQALFSRAETGLLKDDSSPTMPGTVIERLGGVR
tara:strand:+ start:12494 stop:13762 length:1269 start_codon:yes stop_codon:yes gene_type:complete